MHRLHFCKCYVFSLSQQSQWPLYLYFWVNSVYRKWKLSGVISWFEYWVLDKCRWNRSKYVYVYMHCVKEKHLTFYKMFGVEHFHIWNSWLKQDKRHLKIKLYSLLIAVQKRTGALTYLIIYMWWLLTRKEMLSPVFIISFNFPLFTEQLHPSSVCRLNNSNWHKQ